MHRSRTPRHRHAAFRARRAGPGDGGDPARGEPRVHGRDGAPPLLARGARAARHREAGARRQCRRRHRRVDLARCGRVAARQQSRPAAGHVLGSGPDVLAGAPRRDRRDRSCARPCGAAADAGQPLDRRNELHVVAILGGNKGASGSHGVPGRRAHGDPRRRGPRPARGAHGRQAAPCSTSSPCGEGWS